MQKIKKYNSKEIRLKLLKITTRIKNRKLYKQKNNKN